jgi:hypothetical protein
MKHPSGVWLPPPWNNLAWVQEVQRLIRNQQQMQYLASLRQQQPQQRQPQQPQPYQQQPQQHIVAARLPQPPPHLHHPHLNKKSRLQVSNTAPLSSMAGTPVDLPSSLYPFPVPGLVPMVPPRAIHTVVAAAAVAVAVAAAKDSEDADEGDGSGGDDDNGKALHHQTEEESEYEPSEHEDSDGDYNDGDDDDAAKSGSDGEGRTTRKRKGRSTKSEKRSHHSRVDSKEAVFMRKARARAKEAITLAKKNASQEERAQTWTTWNALLEQMLQVWGQDRATVVNAIESRDVQRCLQLVKSHRLEIVHFSKRVRTLLPNNQAWWNKNTLRLIQVHAESGGDFHPNLCERDECKAAVCLVRFILHRMNEFMPVVPLAPVAPRVVRRHKRSSATTCVVSPVAPVAPSATNEVLGNGLDVLASLCCTG